MVEHAKPPPERRTHERSALVATVECRSSDEVAVLLVRNASLNGLFLEARPEQHACLQIGVTVELALSLADASDPEPIRMHGRIVRIEERAAPFLPGFGIAITSADPEAQRRLKDPLVRRRTAQH